MAGEENSGEWEENGRREKVEIFNKQKNKKENTGLHTMTKTTTIKESM